MAELVEPSEREYFEPAEGTHPTPEGRVVSSTCQYYPADKARLDLLRRIVRHQSGIDISRACAERTLIWIFDPEDTRMLKKYLDQAERFYWEDHRRTPGENDGRRKGGKKAASAASRKKPGGK